MNRYQNSGGTNRGAYGQGGTEWDRDDWDEVDSSYESSTGSTTSGTVTSAGEASGGQASDTASSDDPAAEHSLPTVGRAVTPTGSIEVRTTTGGLPTWIHIEKSEMNKSAAALAKTILLLCRQAGTRAGADHRASLLRDGHTLETVSYLGLPNERQAAEIDRVVDDYFDEEETGTWLRQV